MTKARILIVEDEALIAMMLEDFVETLGHEVAGIVDSLEAGLAAVADIDFDLAMLDVNLRERKASWPIADALDEAGKPFLFTSGGDLEKPPERHRSRPFLAKPFTLEGVRAALETGLQTE
ncbi:response regulator [Parasphingopyxis algicola]|uniref:response regulator n=1 Tax=Parasphingopyxis algicola TaxID=2026624 RepID=UPI0015A4505E|nr:response regulator [Parasphingopyxis algicola]QLC24140.1 response regulator [Parasphingopyxis algicola]